MGKLRADFGRAFGARETALKAEEEARALASETVDMTLPIRRKPLGARHPLAKVMEDWEDFFISMGWRISSGPEVEDRMVRLRRAELRPRPSCAPDAGHLLRQGLAGARRRGFVGSNMVLRTQTSSDQVRALLEYGVPLYIASPGRVFRTDELDATHNPGVPPVRGARRGQAPDHGRPEGRAGQAGRGHVRPGGQDPFAPELLPVHRAERRARPVVPGQEGRRRLARMGRLRHGEPERAEVRRPGPGRVHRLRVRHGHRAHAAAAP